MAHGGWIPDLPDSHDVYYEPKSQPGRIKPEVDLRRFCSGVEDQGELLSCTACALVGVMEFFEKRANPTKPVVQLSRLFVYFTAREAWQRTRFKRPRPVEDSGVPPHEGITALKEFGVCTEELWPYHPSKVNERPRADCFSQAAATRRIVSFQRIRQDNDAFAGRDCLSEGFPFVFGFRPYEKYLTSTPRTGRVTLPAPGEVPQEGHVVMAVGYDEARKEFLVRNSEGAAWGDGGYFWMPYEYVGNGNLSEDLWTVRQ